jgi:hypothetical protein
MQMTYRCKTFILSLLFCGCGGGAIDAMPTSCNPQLDSACGEAAGEPNGTGHSGSSGGFTGASEGGSAADQLPQVHCSKNFNCSDSNAFCDLPVNACDPSPAFEPLPPTNSGGNNGGSLTHNLGPGVCTSTMFNCTAISSPVCGCDGKTYVNDCERKRAGTSKRTDGKCLINLNTSNEGGTCGVFAGKGTFTCAEGLFCDFGASGCASQGVPGVCRAFPQTCTDSDIPVCGCDNKTYVNDCQRLNSGVAKEHDGECKPTKRLLAAGVWGGEHAELLVKDPSAGGFIQFDCGNLQIVSPLEITVNGNIMWRAVYLPGSGPSTTAPGTPTRDATLTGATDGKSLKISVQIAGATTQPAFVLQLGVKANFGICL